MKIGGKKVHFLRKINFLSRLTNFILPMNNRQETYVNMFRDTATFGASQAETLNTYPFFDEYFNELTANITQIEKLDRESSVDITGVAADKEKLEDDLATATIAAISRLKMLYKKEQNQQQFNEIDFTKSQIEHVPDNTLLTRPAIISEHLQTNASADPKYGITAERIEALKNLADQYRQVLRSPQDAIKARKYTNENLQELIDVTLKETLKEGLDLVMEMAEEDHPGLYRQYLDARKLGRV